MMQLKEGAEQHVLNHGTSLNFVLEKGPAFARGPGSDRRQRGLYKLLIDAQHRRFKLTFIPLNTWITR